MRRIGYVVSQTTAGAESPRLDVSIMKGLPGAESAMHYCVVCNVTYGQWLDPPPIVIVMYFRCYLRHHVCI